MIQIFCRHFNLKKDIEKNYDDWIVQLYLDGKLPLFYNDLKFYSSPEWHRLRDKVINFYGTKCMKCGDDNGTPHVDHIKPRSRFPHLELVFENMQVLCRYCNISKGNRNFFDYRILDQSNTLILNDESVLIKNDDYNLLADEEPCCCLTV